MKVNKLSFFVLAVLCCIAVSSCSQQDYDIQIPERGYGDMNLLNKNLTKDLNSSSNLSFEYQISDANEYIKYNVYVENNQLHSKLSYKQNDAKWVDISEIDFNFKKVNYKNGMNDIVEKHAETLKKKLDIAIINRVGNILEGLPEILYKKLGRNEYNNELTLSIFYHLAAFNTSIRAYEDKSKDCQCGVNNSYLSGESPFFCAEDVMVSADEAYDLIKERSIIKKSEGYEFNPKSLLQYLSNESGEFVSASKLDRLLKHEFGSYFKKLNKKERLRIRNDYYQSSNIIMTKTPSEYDGWPIDPTCWLYGARAGSDCGCCGNYSGPCYGCSPACYLHDKSCETCEPSWYCLSGCVPGPC